MFGGVWFCDGASSSPPPAVVYEGEECTSAQRATLQHSLCSDVPTGRFGLEVTVVDGDDEEEKALAARPKAPGVGEASTTP